MQKLRMKRLAACLGALAFGVAVLPAISAGSSGGAFDSVYGSGWRGNLVTPNTAIAHFVVSAQNGPQGVSGTYISEFANISALNFKGTITCLSVVGDHAVVGGVITEGDAAQVGGGFAIGFIDSPGLTPDTVTLTDAFAPTPVDCAFYAGFIFSIPTLPFVRGNVVVNDAP